MLDLDTRTAILRLSAEGHGVRANARILKLSRGAVRKVLRRGVAEVPALERDEILDDHLARVRELHGSCKGNLVRVHEEVAAEGIEVGYSSLCQGSAEVIALSSPEVIGRGTVTVAGR